MEEKEKCKIREVGKEESDDSTISHPHGYWFSETGYSKFGRKSRAEQRPAAAVWTRPRRSPLSVHLCLFLTV